MADPNANMAADNLSSPTSATQPGVKFDNSVNVNDKVSKFPGQGNGAHPPNVTSFNPRSCVTCRRRKVKCNKSHPCSNCVKAHIDCIYPAPGRAPRRPRKPPDAELLARLRRLEGVVKNLGVPVDEGGETTTQVTSPASEPANLLKDPSRWSPASSGAASAEHARSAKMGNDFGRLVINEGRSRYVNNPVWATLSSEVQDLKGILDESSSDESSYPSPASNDINSPPRDAFVFGMSSTVVDLTTLMPQADMIAQYWDVYKERCDPVMKTLHIPTMSETIQSVIANGGKASRGLEALMFAIYMAAVTSLSPEECRTTFNEDRTTLLSRYRYGTEQALSKAHFLVTEEIQVLQAFVIMLVCLRRLADPRAIWSLCGLACRIALTIGLHRDGTNFGISPFETEMRRRVWWQVFLLDTRASEDHGSDPSINQTSFDTHLPLHVNDEDLTPSMTAFPEPKQGFTDITFCLIRYETALSFRKLNSPQAPGVENPGSTPAEGKERSIEETHQYLEEKYLQYCDMNIPIHWAACTVARLVMAKQWIILYHPSERTEDGSEGAPSSATLDRIFITCVESLEYALMLERERKVSKWGWMYRSYNQWHPLVFLLSVLKKRTQGPLVERAWRAVDATVVEFGETDEDKKRGHLWKPLRKLVAGARVARKRQLAAEQQSQQPIPGPLLPNGLNPNGPSSLNDRNLELLGQGDGRIVASGLDGSAPMMNGGVNMNYFDPASFSPTAGRNGPPGANVNPGVNTGMTGSYVWDNVSNNIPAHSQFFANQPSINPAQWHDLTNGMSPVNGVVMGDWFSDFSSTNPNSNVPSNAATPAGGAGHPAYHPSSAKPHSNTSMPSRPGAFTSNPPSTASEDPMRRLSVGTSPPLAPGSSFSDPMVSGSDDGGMPWEDWDAMMREFDMNAAAGGGPPGGVGAGGQWGRRPMLGESWL